MEPQHQQQDPSPPSASGTPNSELTASTATSPSGTTGGAWSDVGSLSLDSGSSGCCLPMLEGLDDDDCDDRDDDLADMLMLDDIDLQPLIDNVHPLGLQSLFPSPSLDIGSEDARP